MVASDGTVRPLWPMVFRCEKCAEIAFQNCRRTHDFVIHTFVWP